MDPVDNPFAPGAGNPPPELAGRDAVRKQMLVCIQRLKKGRAAKSIMLAGLRGVGKTVLLDQMMRDAIGEGGLLAIRIEAPEGRSLPALLAPKLRLALLKLSQIEAAKDYASPFRPSHTGREEVPESHGRAGARTASIGGHCLGAGP
ncbi:ATP-binding protein [Caballeronia sp. LZ032]|uniref:ATP-binding protein n=1 Tax=Caballeronia sp. LZ032 TaxID=3038565 RepID=UPI00286D4C48|nr:ATP-binding protein [Caballeronia sp. LZ032]